MTQASSLSCSMTSWSPLRPRTTYKMKVDAAHVAIQKPMQTSESKANC
jgi:hypothetical protein